MRRALLALISVLLVGVAIASPAQATTLDEVASSLQSDPVYNDPNAEMALTGAQADDLRAKIESGDTDIYIAILPDAAKANRTAPDVLQYLESQVGEPGEYGVVVGKSFRATPAAAATDAFDSQRSNGLYAVLDQYVSNVQSGAFSGGDAGSGDTSSSGSSGVFAGLLVLFFAMLPMLFIGGIIAVFAGVFISRSRKKKKADAEALAQVKETLDEDITAFGESLDSVDADQITTEEDRNDWLAALDQYDKAKDAAAKMTHASQAVGVTEALDEGRYRVACVQARMAGDPLPERRPPCFFDPRHGLSISDVAYIPYGTTVPREVPACAACATAIADGTDPQARYVNAGAAGRVPYWQAGPQYGAYASGYYGPDLFTTVMFGTMLGNAFSNNSGDWSGSSNDGGGSWGDFGGGDFGGSDFGGGGDFGGGDF